MIKLFFSCEHGGNVVPAKYRTLFEPHNQILRTHKGWDIGILQVAKETSGYLSVELVYSETTRLLVELNRSLNNPELFSNISKTLSDQGRENVLQEFYFPYRNKVENNIGTLINSGNKVIHISFHSFTPFLNGEERTADIGLLYDPDREQEQKFCELWKKALISFDSEFRVKFNYPYLGVEDGFTTYLRTKYRDPFYAGIELEINQKFLTDEKGKALIAELIKTSVQKAMDQLTKDS